LVENRDFFIPLAFYAATPLLEYTWWYASYYWQLLYTVVNKTKG